MYPCISLFPSRSALGARVPTARLRKAVNRNLSLLSLATPLPSHHQSGVSLPRLFHGAALLAALFAFALPPASPPAPAPPAPSPAPLPAGPRAGALPPAAAGDRGSPAGRAQAQGRQPSSERGAAAADTGPGRGLPAGQDRAEGGRTRTTRAMSNTGMPYGWWDPSTGGDSSPTFWGTKGKGSWKGGPGVGPFRGESITCLLYTSPSPRDKRQSRMPSSA